MSENTIDKAPGVIEQITNLMSEVGYCVVPNVLRKAEARQVASIVLELQEAEARIDTGDLGHARVLYLLAKHPVFVQLLAHPLVVAVNEAYLGADCVCSTFSSNCAFPDSDLTYWHCDHPYWTIAAPYQVDPPLTAHTIWYLTDITEETGGTKFVPGSQERRFLPEHNGNYDHEGHTPRAPAGSVIFAHGTTWHSAGSNTTDATRLALFVRYARSFLIPQEGLRAQLDHVVQPSELVQRLMGAQQYQPQRGYPY
jgi:ectoine hydroxylase-related dioxygenase (phytanoyl-CoA dioxygenase family)